MATVTYFLPGGLLPREISVPFWGRVSDEVLAYYAPEGAYAFERSDKQGICYINGGLFSVDWLKMSGRRELAQEVISDGALYAVRLENTHKWVPFFQVTDRIVMTDR